MESYLVLQGGVKMTWGAWSPYNPPKLSHCALSPSQNPSSTSSSLKCINLSPGNKQVRYDKTHPINLVCQPRIACPVSKLIRTQEHCRWWTIHHPPPDVREIKYRTHKLATGEFSNFTAIGRCLGGFVARPLFSKSHKSRSRRLSGPPTFMDHSRCIYSLHSPR